MSGWYVVYIIACIINAAMAVLVADLHFVDWQYWAWILIPSLAYVCGQHCERGD